MSKSTEHASVLWISSTRYHTPLPDNLSRKWQALVDGLNRPIYVIGFSESWRPDYFEQHVRFYLLPKPSIAVLRYLMIFSLGTWLALYLTLRHGCHLLLAQSPFEGAIGAFVKQVVRVFGRQVRLVVESHNDFEEALFMQRDVGAKGLYRRIMGMLANYALHHADALRPVSSSAAEQLKQYAPEIPQHTFMAWVDVASFARVPRQKPLNDSQSLVYAGVLIPRKGIHFLLDAFSQLDQPQARLVIAGPPDNPTYAAELRQQAQRWGIAERVEFTGGLSQADLGLQFSQARALVLPSLSEGLPRVIVEAMVAGLPVIATTVSGIPDIVVDGEHGYLVPPEDVPALLKALQSIYDQDVTQMGAEAQARANSFFSTERFVDGYRDLFALAERD
ncbi:MAG: glycosyltransferase family 4 protein [Anaerolineae bacterium]|nr:glycosyltransferase family 4 protein [Anaerolineae bacterium]